MTGLPNYNYPAFYMAAMALRRAGHEVISPAELHPDPMTDPRPREHYMRVDLAALLTADAVVLLPGWADSYGARLEVDVARATGIEVLVLDESEVGAAMAQAAAVWAGEVAADEAVMPRAGGEG